jgi:hypothetical protein
MGKGKMQRVDKKIMRSNTKKHIGRKAHYMHIWKYNESHYFVQLVYN